MSLPTTFFIGRGGTRQPTQITLDGKTLTEYMDGDISGMVYGSANSSSKDGYSVLTNQIETIWSNSAYAQRTFAPVTTLLYANRPNSPFPYGGNNWESAWWVDPSTGDQQDGMLVKFSSPTYISEIFAANPHETENNSGNTDLAVYRFSGNPFQGSTPTIIGSRPTLSGNGPWGTISVFSTHQWLFFKLSGSTAWNRIEEIYIRG